MVTRRPRKTKNKQGNIAATRKPTAAKPKKVAAAASSRRSKLNKTPVPKKGGAKKSAPVLDQFLEKITDETKHEDIRTLHALVASKASSLEPELQGKATLAYGGFDYQTKSKCSGRWARIGIMVNKTGLSLMVSGEKGGKYLLETYPKKHFGKASVGKSCLRFKKLEDLNMEAISGLIEDAAKAKLSSVAIA